MEAMEVRKAAAELRAIWVVGNEYLQAAAPWSVVKTDPDTRRGDRPPRAEPDPRLRGPVAPLHPRRRRGDDGRRWARDDWTWPDDISAALRTLPPGHGFTVPENLFRKITDEERADWQQRFSGVRA